MPEVRRRGLSDQIGVGADRTQRGAAQGGGMGPTIARLQQAVRARVTASPSRSSGSLSVTEFSVPAVNGSYTEGVVSVAGLYIIKAEALISASAPALVALDLSGAGEGSDRIDYRPMSLTADAVGAPIFATGQAWCEEGVTLSSSISGATVTNHSLTYTLVAVS